jgi:hypothetical protein
LNLVDIFMNRERRAGIGRGVAGCGQMSNNFQKQERRALSVKSCLAPKRAKPALALFGWFRLGGGPSFGYGTGQGATRYCSDFGRFGFQFQGQLGTG